MATLQITNEGEQKQQLDKAPVQAVEEHGIKGSSAVLSARPHMCILSQGLPFCQGCRSKMTQHWSGQTQASANAIEVQSQQDTQKQVQMYATTHTRREPWPTIEEQVFSSTGTKSLGVLPDSGAEITAAGKDVLTYLDHHPDNLFPSTVIPRAVNGSSMTPLGRIPIAIHLQGKQYTDALHIIPGVKGTVISWQAAKSLARALSKPN